MSNVQLIGHIRRFIVGLKTEATKRIGGVAKENYWGSQQLNKTSASERYAQRTLLGYTEDFLKSPSGM